MLISQFEGLDVYLIELNKKYYIKGTVGSNFMLYDIQANLLNFNAEFPRIQYLAIEAWILDREDELKRAISNIKANKPVGMIDPLSI